MHRLYVHVYVACVLHPHECMHRMRLLYLVRIYAEARPGPPSRRALLLHRMSALSHDSYLHLFRPPSRSVIPPLAMQSLMCQFVVLYLCLSVLQCLSSPSISFALSLCNFSCAHSLSFILSPCMGPRLPPWWCAALHAYILPYILSPFLSFTLPLCVLPLTHS